MPKVSVIIPTHNRAAFLQAAIQSVLNQTFQDFEIIVVDDASEDQTAEVVRRFPDPRMQYIRHETNKGQGASRNAGIGRASGEYVALLDDDDEWLPEKLEKQVQLLDAAPSRVGLVYTGYSRIDATSNQPIGRFTPKKRGYVFEDMCTDNWIGTCSTVLSRGVCFNKTGLFDEGLASWADYDMWLRISREFAVDYICEPLVSYRVHGNRISTNYDSLIRGIEAFLKKHDSLFAMNRKTCSRCYLTLGVLYFCNKNPAKGRKAILKAIQLNPLEIRHYFNLGLSLLGANNFKKFKEFRDTYLRFSA